MNTEQANALLQGLNTGSVTMGASRFLYTIPALKPSEMYIKVDQENFDPNKFHGDSFYPLNGGFVVDFGENFIDNPTIDQTTFEGLEDAKIIELTLPSATQTIGTRAFDQKTTDKSPLLLIIPESVKLIKPEAFNRNFFSTICFFAKDITIQNGAFGAETVNRIIFAQKEGNIYIESIAFSLMYDEKKLTTINLPEKNKENKLMITIEDEGLSWLGANINVPESYTQDNPNTQIGNNAFAESYNVNYNGKDERAPWGAARLNGKEV